MKVRLSNGAVKEQMIKQQKYIRLHKSDTVPLQVSKFFLDSSDIWSDAYGAAEKFREINAKQWALPIFGVMLNLAPAYQFQLYRLYNIRACHPHNLKAAPFTVQPRLNG